MTDWQEAYFDLVNKVECECVQQGDLVPIWGQFKRMALTIQKLQGNQAALEVEHRADAKRIAELEAANQDDAEADAYCDEHNRALIGVAVQTERQRITAWLRQLDMPDGTTETIANWIDEGMHLP